MFKSKSSLCSRLLALALAALALFVLTGLVRSSAALAETAQTTGESTVTTGETAQTTGESAETAGKSTETTGESAETTGESTETTGESAETTGESAETTGESEAAGEDEKAKAEEEAATKRRSTILAIIGGAIAAAFIVLIAFTHFGKKGIANKKITASQLTESALMVAVATVCSLIKIDLPFGGGVTIVSMLPLVIISHRYGWRWGVTTAFVYSLIQLIFGLDNVGYATSTAMAFGVIFLDYIVAYTVIGLAGAFGNSTKGIVNGILVTFFLRFLCHYVTGVWIWDEWMPEKFFGLTMTSPWIYSALYNGWYMLAETVITVVVALIVNKNVKGFFSRVDEAM